jgi:hypothetical protein
LLHHKQADPRLQLTPLRRIENWQESFTLNNLHGALPPTGVWDPLGLAAKADEKTLKRYREAKVTHGRVAMIAVVGFLVNETVEGSSFLFDAQIS